MADLDSLINSKISLISHQDLRYDGTLFSINTEESSIVLKDVQCLGTEDRIADPAKKIPSNPAIIPFVTFPGEEIKDLYVHEEAAKAAATSLPDPPKQTNDSKTNKQSNDKKNIYQPPKPPSGTETNEKGKKQYNNAHSHQNKSNISSTTTTVRRENKSDGVGAGTGAHLLKMRERRGNDGSAAAPLATTGEFDFEAGLNVFKKDEVLAKVASEKEEVKEVKYKKDDFFDSISCDLLDRQEGIKNRLTPGEERVLNQDTFGAVALQNNNYRRNFRGGGRGGGGGRYYNNNNNGGRYYNNGGGRGRGRGRGNNNNNNNSTPVASASA